MPTLTQNRDAFAEIFSNTSHRFNQDEFLDVVCEWMTKNMQAHEVFDHITDRYQEGFVDGYAEGKEKGVVVDE